MGEIAGLVESTNTDRRHPGLYRKQILGALVGCFEMHGDAIEAIPDLHSVSFTVYIHGAKTECVVEYRAQATRRSSL